MRKLCLIKVVSVGLYNISVRTGNCYLTTCGPDLE